MSHCAIVAKNGFTLKSLCVSLPWYASFEEAEESVERSLPLDTVNDVFCVLCCSKCLNITFKLIPLYIEYALLSRSAKAK